MTLLGDVLWGLLNWGLRTPVLKMYIKSQFRRLPHLDSLGYERVSSFMFFGGPVLYNIPKLSNVVVDAKIELHQAIRAGDHLDFRIKMPNERVYDFVLTKRTEFPLVPGKPMNIVRTPHHSLKYFNTDKAVFAPGEYGAGIMNTVWRGKIDIHYASSKKLEFTIPQGQFKGKYAILDTGKGWIINRMVEINPEVYWKERMPFVNSDAARSRAYNSSDYISEVKLNGAHFYLIGGPKGCILISRRIGVDGKPITREHNIPQVRDMILPKAYQGRRIHVEIVSGYNDRTTSSARTAGLLNAMPELSRANQVRLKAPLRLVAFDIEGPGTYLDRKAELVELSKCVEKLDMRFCGYTSHRFLVVRCINPRIMSVVEDNRASGMSPENYTRYLKASGYEGAVLKKTDGLYYIDPHIKDKNIDTVDLIILGFQGGAGKHLGRLGALICKDPETGGVIKVGTGFSDRERELIWNNQQILMNQRVMVDANWRTEGGSLHGPRFVGIHPEGNGDILGEAELFDYVEALSNNKTDELILKHKLINRSRS